MFREPNASRMIEKHPRQLVSKPIVKTICTPMVACICLINSSANAECRVLPGPDGEVTTWLTTLPIATARRGSQVTVEQQLSRVLPQIDLQNLTPIADAPWRPLSSNSTRLRLPDGRGPRTSFYGLTLRVAQQSTVYLFSGADDGLAILLDGREVGRRASVRPSREDDDVTVLNLAPGSHRLVLRQYVNGGEQSLFARIVGADFLPTNTVQLVLDGVTDAQCNLLAQGAIQLQTQRSVVAEGTRVEVTLRYPGGTAFRANETSRVITLADGTSPELSLTGRFVGAVSVAQVVPTASTEIHAIVGSVDRALDLRVAAETRAALLRASAVLDPLREESLPPWLPRASLWSARYVQQRLTQLVRDADNDAAHLREEAALLSQLCDDVQAGRDPYLNRRGAMRRAYRSAVDGSLQPYSIYVPQSFRRGNGFPLVVALHGLHGSSHRMLPILFGRYDKDEDRTHADRHFEPLPDAPAILLAPYGHGDAYYRGVGELDVLRAIEEVRAAYGIDADRTYMTGLSMGGIGAASIPLHYPSLFAAAAPLCGYHDYFIRGDTHPPRRSWEEFAMQARSNRNWAENGLNLPMYVVQGTLDRPITNSTTFVDRYRELHQEIESEYPELGHDVWSTTYADGRIFQHFLHYRRPSAPAHVRFRTISTRWHQSFWVSVDRLARNGAWAEIDAQIVRNSLRISSQNVLAMTLSPEPSALRVPYEIQLTGETRATLRVERAGPVTLERSAPAGPWTLASAQHVAAPLGPIRDELDRHILVVYGARDPAQTALNRRVAEQWAKIKAGVRAQVQIISDEDYRPAMAAATTVILVGTLASNRVTERMNPTFAIRISANEIAAQNQRFAAATGTTFVARSPDAPDGSVIVVSGTSALGVWRSLSLPDLLPDYVVYNDGLAPARGRVILGRYAGVECAGYYDQAGQVEPNCHDTRPTDTRAGDGGDTTSSSANDG